MADSGYAVVRFTAGGGLRHKLRSFASQPAEATRLFLFRFPLLSLPLTMLAYVFTLQVLLKQLTKLFFHSLDFDLIFFGEFCISKVLSWRSTENCQQTIERSSCVVHQRDHLTKLNAWVHMISSK